MSNKFNKPISGTAQIKNNRSIPLLANSSPPLLPTPLSKLNQDAMKGNKNFRFIPADVRAEKIAKGLCYYCDQA